MIEAKRDQRKQRKWKSKKWGEEKKISINHGSRVEERSNALLIVTIRLNCVRTKISQRRLQTVRRRNKRYGCNANKLAECRLGFVLFNLSIRFKICVRWFSGTKYNIASLFFFHRVELSSILYSIKKLWCNGRFILCQIIIN